MILRILYILSLVCLPLLAFAFFTFAFTSGYDPFFKKTYSYITNIKDFKALTVVSVKVRSLNENTDEPVHYPTATFNNLLKNHIKTKRSKSPKIKAPENAVIKEFIVNDSVVLLSWKEEPDSNEETFLFLNDDYVDEHTFRYSPGEK